MCGIFFSLSAAGYGYPDEDTVRLLQNRGPDIVKTHSFQLDHPKKVGQNLDKNVSSLRLTFISTVLALRGDYVQTQPLVDAASRSVLCWNGEAWKIHSSPINGNDTKRVFRLFLEAVQPTTYRNGISSSEMTDSQSLAKVANAVGAISGPFSFIFYDGYRQRLFFGRDCLGRRSLLSGWDNAGNFKICSVCDGIQSENFEEVDTDGIHMINIAHLLQSSGSGGSTSNSLHSIFNVKSLGWENGDTTSTDQVQIRNPIPLMNKILPMEEIPPLLRANCPSIETLEVTLRESIRLRLSNIPEPPFFSSEYKTKVAVLFSGGLDCTILARLAHDILPIDEPIDLLNVAFENPRVVAAAAVASKSQSPTLSAYEACPDRITGRSSCAELQRVCFNRHWRFVAINIPYTETLSHREKVRRLMRPHNTEMDLSIACALYFASRGQGEITNEGDYSGCIPYTTTARVLLSGLGADEVFAGYTRHETAFSRHGFQGLVDEIALDVCRLSKRNLGRDDRVISHWGREVRYPFLDNDFLAWALACPVWEKCGFGAMSSSPSGICGDVEESGGGEQSLEPGKRSLRLLAWKLGMKNVAREKKRAIQFGSRTAKMESGRSKGTQILT
ncbi:hypothetical protein PABG_00358 [Paracoccidioides brasiliensis Pb03]|nr:hypothetical protein PABG_00358 [Paracoccidioides brasiliensis Pb03]